MNTEETKYYWTEAGMGENTYINHFQNFGNKVLWSYFSSQKWDDPVIAQIYISKNAFDQLEFDDDELVQNEAFVDIFAFGKYNLIMMKIEIQDIIKESINNKDLENMVNKWYEVIDFYDNDGLYDYIEEKLEDYLENHTNISIKNIGKYESVDDLMDDLPSKCKNYCDMLCKLKEYIIEDDIIVEKVYENRNDEER